MTLNFLHIPLNIFISILSKKKKKIICWHFLFPHINAKSPKQYPHINIYYGYKYYFQFFFFFSYGALKEHKQEL